MSARTASAGSSSGSPGSGWSRPCAARRPGSQRNRAEAPWDYKVVALSYNPGESLSDERRAALYERTLVDQGRQGWEPVGSLLSRDTVQTVGGGVTTGETTSFVAFRRPR